MDSNDMMRRLRFAVALDDADAARLVTLGGEPADATRLAAWRAREGEENYALCPLSAISALLTGLVLDRRGPPPARSAGKERKGSSTAPAAEGSFNNRVLKQLRIALELKDRDVLELIEAGGGRLSRAEVNALFRKPGTRNYRACGDQVLRWFLTGLATRRVRGEA